MTHFTVLVPADNEANLENKLTPYYEYGCSEYMDEKVRPHLTFKIEHRSGSFHEDAFQIFGRLRGDEKYYADYRRWLQEGNYEEIFKSWNGGEKNEKGEWGHWMNPQAHWDWFGVSGRWTGILLLKPFANREQSGNGEPGLMTEPNTDPESCDYALAGDVDWKTMADIELRNHLERYRERQHYLELAKTAEFPEKIEGEAIDLFIQETSRGEKARKTFKTIEICKLWELASHLAQTDKKMWWDDWEQVEEYLTLTEEEYKTRFKRDALTYAFIDLEGKWNQRGEMGWWGMDDKSKGTQDYDEAFWIFVESLPDTQRVYVVDAHI